MNSLLKKELPTLQDEPILQEDQIIYRPCSLTDSPLPLPAWLPVMTWLTSASQPDTLKDSPDSQGYLGCQLPTGRAKRSPARWSKAGLFGAS
jgi:hypothetical protein